jgi:hypothetical protein
VAFSFGGWSLLDNARKVPIGHTIAIAFVVVLSIGLVTSALALWGMLLSHGQRFIDEREMFRRDVVAYGKTRLDFRSHVAAHYWFVWQFRRKRTERRAKIIQVGQWFFVGFLLAVLLLSGLTAWSAVHRPKDPELPPCKVVISETMHTEAPGGTGPTETNPIAGTRPKPGVGRPGIGSLDAEPPSSSVRHPRRPHP